MPAPTDRRRQIASLIGRALIGRALIATSVLTGCGGASVQRSQPPPVTAAATSTRASGTTAPPVAKPGEVSPTSTRTARFPPPSTRTARIPPPAQQHLHGSGIFRTAPAPDRVRGSGRLVHYAVQIESGIRVDAAQFAAQVHATLVDPRGWQGVDHVAFTQVADINRASIVVTLATPDTADRLCAPLDTAGWLDCWNGSRAVINSDRWLYGAASYGRDLTAYRHEVINHEVGHGLGHRHLLCPGRGRLAPVMQQQTISLQGCRANPWPRVTGG